MVARLSHEERIEYMVRYALARRRAVMIYDLTELVEALLEQVVYPAIDEEVRATRIRLDDRVWSRIKANCRRFAKSKRVVIEVKDK